MAYVPNSGSVVAFQNDPSKLQASVAGTVQVAYGASIVTAHPLDIQLTSSMIGMVTDTIIHGKTTGAGGGYVEVKVDPSGAIVTALSSTVSFQGGTWNVGLNSTNASVITVSQGSIGAVIVGGSIAASFTPPANQSVSGTVGATQQGTWISSIVNTVPSSVLVGTSIFGQLPAGTAVLGSVAALQGTNPWVVVSSIAGGIFPISGSVAATITNTNVNVSGSVAAFQAGTQITSVSGQVTVVSSLAGGLFPISGSVAAAQIGTWSTSVMTNVITSIATAGQVMGSVATLQGTNPWIVNFQNSSILAVPVGSVQVVLRSPSIVGTYAEDAAHTSGDKGLFTLGVRNDTVASFVSANTEYTPIGVDSAGRTMIKPFAPGEASIIAVTSIVSAGKAASVQLFAAPGAGLKNYITDFNIANSGATTTVVLFADSDSSILGRTIAPTGGGSNYQFATPLVTTRTNTVVNLEILSSSSIVYATVTGFKAP